MISYNKGDILQDESEALVNTVNCVGVMGRGIALQFKNKYPSNFKEYAQACGQKRVKPGQMFIHQVGELRNPKYIINFPTKRHWRNKSRMEDVENGLKALAQEIRELEIRSVAVPPLGCGLGGLDWGAVKKLIIDYLGQLDDVEITVYEPAGAPPAGEMAKSREIPKMTPGRAALVELMHRYLSGLLDPFVSLLEVHKLMYFMQEAGEPLRLRYNKGPYGPFAENLTHVLRAIEGHMISGYADGGDNPAKQLRLVPGAYDEAVDYLKTQDGTRERFARVSDLVTGFESPFGMELLTSVHWVMKHDHADDLPEIVGKTHAWNVRKQKFTPRQIEMAALTLAEKGWVASKEFG